MPLKQVIRKDVPFSSYSYEEIKEGKRKEYNNVNEMMRSILDD